MWERGHLESPAGVACWHSDCSLAKLKQLAGAEHRLVQLGVGNHSQEEEERALPRQLDVAPNADSFLRCLWERGEVWGAEEQGLGEHGMEEVPLQRQGRAGR